MRFRKGEVQIVFFFSEGACHRRGCLKKVLKESLGRGQLAQKGVMQN